ncbi:head GIN domain-containing protein [Flavimarina sp. Hel_I_48]|uniref:head GIN domain-containing protein n=1 Tax=Flavimarina sp. Hel_I_48 TaxID=1392488 RepID=UPI0004DF80FC|nr:head GIN domain-containing protein [Flavimarina sp. Hel_I_48]
MKKLLFIFLAIGLSTAAHAQWGSKKVEGNGSMTQTTRELGSYDAVHVAGFFDVFLVAGEEGTVKLEGESNLLDHVITEVKGNVLRIEIEDRMNLQPSNNKTITVTVPFKELSEVNLSGSGDVVARDPIVISTFSTALSGSGDIILEVNATNVEANLRGSGDLTLKGTAQKVELDLRGSGDIHASDLSATDADASIAGSGDISLHCDGGKLKARITGSGDIEYSGKPSQEDSSVVGSGSISN